MVPINSNPKRRERRRGPGGGPEVDGFITEKWFESTTKGTTTYKFKLNQLRDCDDVSGVGGGGGGGSSSNWRIDSDITVRTPRRR